MAAIVVAGFSNSALEIIAEQSVVLSSTTARYIFIVVSVGIGAVVALRIESMRDAHRRITSIIYLHLLVTASIVCDMIVVGVK